MSIDTRHVIGLGDVFFFHPSLNVKIFFCRYIIVCSFIDIKIKNHSFVGSYIVVEERRPRAEVSLAFIVKRE